MRTRHIISDLFDKHFVNTADQFDKALLVYTIARDIDGKFNSPTDAAMSAILISAQDGAHKLPYEMLMEWSEVKDFIAAVDAYFPEA